MSSLQTDINDTSADCYNVALAMQPEVQAIFDKNNYDAQTYNFSDFLNLAQLATFKWMDTIDACNYTGVLVLLDEMMSQAYRLYGSTGNLIT